MSTTAIAERIATLKRIRNDNSLSFEQIYNLVAATNDPLSMTTIKKVFCDGEESLTVTNRTVCQLERVLCGIYGDPASAKEESSLIQELREQNKFMREVIVEMNGNMRIILGMMDSGHVPSWQISCLGGQHGKED